MTDQQFPKWMYRAKDGGEVEGKVFDGEKDVPEGWSETPDDAAHEYTMAHTDDEDAKAKAEADRAEKADQAKAEADAQADVQRKADGLAKDDNQALKDRESNERAEAQTWAALEARQAVQARKKEEARALEQDERVAENDNRTVEQIKTALTAKGAAYDGRWGRDRLLAMLMQYPA